MKSLRESGTFGRVPDAERAFVATGTLTPSDAFRILADEHRRFVCYLLVDRGGTVPVEELADCIAGTHPGASRNPGLPDRARRRLYHNHLPRLAEHGVVDYDRDAETVSLTDLGERLEPFLETAMEHEPVDVDAFLDVDG